MLSVTRRTSNIGLNVGQRTCLTEVTLALRLKNLCVKELHCLVEAALLIRHRLPFVERCHIRLRESQHLSGGKDIVLAVVHCPNVVGLVETVDVTASVVLQEVLCEVHIAHVIVRPEHGSLGRCSRKTNRIVRHVDIFRLSSHLDTIGTVVA